MMHLQQKGVEAYSHQTTKNWQIHCGDSYFLRPQMITLFVSLRMD